jgi:hypothetical protein
MKEVKVTKLPPGRALGAGDLHYWSSNRLAGRAGTFNKWDHKRQQKQKAKDRKGPRTTQGVHYRKVESDEVPWD